ncbi:MAG: hypothetical protein EVA34_13425 [Erythrobacter sp.]|nr:MAG: hypothetical protein EVA34_13425 [Erythrobacter sp.]
MKWQALLFLGLTISGAGTASADERTVKPGYKASGEPITNPAHPGYDPDLIVCRDWRKTGTRAKVRNVCLTNKRWARVMRDGNSFARSLVRNASGENTGGW